MRNFIKWHGFKINDELYTGSDIVRPSSKEIFIELRMKDQEDAYFKFKEKYSEICSILFEEIDAQTLKFIFPLSGYIALDLEYNRGGEITPLISPNEIIIRKFLENNTLGKPENKPVELWESSYNIEAYRLFCTIIKSIAGWDQYWCSYAPPENPGAEPGYMTIHFNRHDSCICSDGNEFNDIEITIRKEGVSWERLFWARSF